MKHFLMGLGVLGMLSLTACSTNDDPNGGGNVENGENRYLAVNIVPTANNGTRAEGDQMDGDPDGAKYEEGYENENKVNSVRFYFFNEDGTAAAVKANGSNWFDWTAPEVGGQNMPNIEKQLQATLVIHTGKPENEGLPAKIVAVLNPVNEGLENVNIDLQDLRDREKDYVATIKGENGAFVMMNSVYDQSGEIAATTVSAANYAPSKEVALANPVNIYVERAVAKVRVKFADNIKPNANGMIALKNSEDKPIMVGDKQVYLKVGKWNVTADTDLGYLSKHIDPATWGIGTDLFGSEYWNHNPYFRSFWAINAKNAKQNWHSYNDIAANNGKDYNGSLENSIYTNENAPQIGNMTEENSTNPYLKPFTKVILAGQLVDENGAAIEVVKYGGQTFAGEETLKTQFLANLKANGMIYYQTTDEDGTKSFKALDDPDVVFKTALESNIAQPTEAETGRYRVYLQLSEEGAKKEWYKGDNKDSEKFADINAVNDYLAKEFGAAQIYKTGLTYYYFPIRHLGDANHIGYYGVVRNHIYDCVISTIYGLGTPVYDPDEKIYPEKPKDDDTFIAARINILSWRLVPNKVELKW